MGILQSIGGFIKPYSEKGASVWLILKSIVRCVLNFVFEQVCPRVILVDHVNDIFPFRTVATG